MPSGAEKCRSQPQISIGGTLSGVTRMERLWDAPWGWLVPYGIPWKLGRRDGRNGCERSGLTIFVVFDAWSVSIYERGRAMSLADLRSG